MSNIVFLEPNKIDAEPFTTSDIIAARSENEHETIVRLLADYRADFKEFGPLRFSDLKSGNPKGGRPTRIYRLNEQQATLLITYLKNTLPVRTFKKELVRQFYLMKAELQQRHIERAQLKPVRRNLTDTIKALDLDKWAYKRYTDLAYIVVMGITAAKIRQQRTAPHKAKAIDYMTAEEIAAVTKAENQIAVLLELGMCYQQVKAAMLNRLALTA